MKFLTFLIGSETLVLSAPINALIPGKNLSTLTMSNETVDRNPIQLFGAVGAFYESLVPLG